MADINMPQKNGKRKVHSLRVDLTPMVDLGFLLISFFMLTTTMAKSRTMEINMPSPAPEKETIYPDESTITIIPVEGHKVFCYKGVFKDNIQPEECPVSGLRDVLMKMKEEDANFSTTLSANAHELHVLIKPGDDSKYGDLVNLFDDMNISQVPYYALVDITPEEKDWLLKK